VPLTEDVVLDRIAAAMRYGRNLVLATVVETKGEVPVCLGDKMILDGDDARGDMGEAGLSRRVRADCRASLESRTSELRTYRLSQVAEGPEKWDPEAEAAVFLEVIEGPPTLLIAGAGHIAQPLAQLGKIMGFRVVVVDDRAEFASRERFPEADEVIAEDFARALGGYPINEFTYIVLITRGHRHDEVCLREILHSPAAYIGMIGSKRRVATVLEDMAREGFSKEAIGRLYAPIGIDIAAETPEEIALSIMSEVVNVRRGGPAPSMKLSQPGS